ncbi:amine oxidase [Trametopsis cervina]|nr:amine oxidase [Trametopsis cervina]
MVNLAVRSQDYSSVRANAAKHVVNKTIEWHNSIFQGPGRQIPTPPQPIPEGPPSSTRPIGIVGAGCAGLYAAMILETLRIPYEILESNNRIGGRIFTHRFTPEARDAPVNDPRRYDYVDIGAMRFPNIPFMKRVFNLFDRLELDDLLIEYKYDANNTFDMYNGVRHNSADPTPQGVDIYGVSETQGGTVPDSFVQQGVDNVAAAIFKPYSEAFNNLPFPEAWKLLAEQDPYSTRGYLLSKEKYPEPVVEWLETFQTATGLYNDAFVESTMDAMDFGSSTAKTDSGKQGKPLDYSWYCIDGGSDHITDRMAKKLSVQPVTDARVTTIATIPGGVKVVTRSRWNVVEEHTYSQVICTAPLGCLAAIDISREDLSYTQRVAIRALNYDTSTKVALKFKSRWWEDPKIMNDRPIKGGSSSTDLPIRTCVYPSYGLTTTGTPSGVLLASYTWAQDAQRLGGLAQPSGTDAAAQLVELTLDNLSQLHGVSREAMGPLLDAFAYDWHNDPHARGAFALFGPGQFGQSEQGNSLFASMKSPAGRNGRLHIAGEATSAHHAWVLGALNSAWRAVYNALGQLEPEERDSKRAEMVKEWGVPDEEDVKALVELAVLARYKML